MNKIYLIDTNVFNNKDIYDYWYNIMSDDRKKKIDKCLYDKDKRLLLGAGVLLYRGLKVLDIKDIELEYNDYGKPYVMDNQIYFNISHTDHYVVCAFSDKEIGIDIEKKKEIDEQVIERICLSDEKEYIKDNALLYTQLWTMKESLLKYLGIGIMMNMHDIHIDIDKNVCLDCPGLSKKIYFTNLLMKDYSITVCSEYANFSEDIIEIKLFKDYLIV